MQETRAFNGSTREETGAAIESSRTNIFSGRTSGALLLGMLFFPTNNSIWTATALLRRPKLPSQLTSVPFKHP